MAKIRVGLIRCDVHAMYYGQLMEKFDVDVLRSVPLGQVSFFYHHLDCGNAEKLTVPTVSGFEIVKCWDADPETAEGFKAIFRGKPKVCKSFEEVSDDVDLVFIADCDFDGSDKLELATPGIKKRVPTFIDKPLSYEIPNAKKLVSMAKRYDVPIMSLSLLRKVPQAALFRNRLKELGKPHFGVIRGGWGNMAGHIHAISLAQHLFGPGVLAVEAMGPHELAYVHLDYGKKPPNAGVMLCCRGGATYHCSFYASAYSNLGAIHSSDIGDFEYPFGATVILKLIKKMVKTRQPQAPYDEMLECIAIATAGRLSQKLKRPVTLKEVMKMR